MRTEPIVLPNFKIFDHINSKPRAEVYRVIARKRAQVPGTPAWSVSFSVDIEKSVDHIVQHNYISEPFFGPETTISEQILRKLIREKPAHFNLSSYIREDEPEAPEMVEDIDQMTDPATEGIRAAKERIWGDKPLQCDDFIVLSVDGGNQRVEAHVTDIKAFSVTVSADYGDVGHGDEIVGNFVEFSLETATNRSKVHCRISLTSPDVAKAVLATSGSNA